MALNKEQPWSTDTKLMASLINFTIRGGTCTIEKTADSPVLIPVGL